MLSTSSTQSFLLIASLLPSLIIELLPVVCIGQHCVDDRDYVSQRIVHHLEVQLTGRVRTQTYSLGHCLSECWALLGLATLRWHCVHESLLGMRLQMVDHLLQVSHRFFYFVHLDQFDAVFDLLVRSHHVFVVVGS